MVFLPVASKLKEIEARGLNSDTFKQDPTYTYHYFGAYSQLSISDAG